MKNKIIISVYVPSLDETYELYVPVNETINRVLDLIVKLIKDFSDSEFGDDTSHVLVDPKNGTPYNIDLLLRDTNIRNSKFLLLI